MPQKLEITLSDDIAADLRARIAAGEFRSANELVETALAAWLDEPQLQPSEDAALRRRIRRSLDDPRPSVPADEAWARIDAHVRRRESEFER